LSQRKNKEINYKKYILRGIIKYLICAATVLAVLTAVSGCGCKKENNAEQTTEIEETAASKSAYSQDEISGEFYDSSVFIGNSFVDDLMRYDLIDGADYFGRVGLNVTDAAKKSTSTGNVPVIDELGNGREYKKIFMMFGENELGWPNTEMFEQKYKELIDKARKYQKDAEIYLLAVTPVSKAVSLKNEDCTNNERIVEFNELIKKIASDNNCKYGDVYTPVADEDGSLPDSAASDGIHFGEKYYKKCLLYIQNNS
jgi:hypothetical protein